jgi:hypothetical protein
VEILVGPQEIFTISGFHCKYETECEVTVIVTIRYITENYVSKLASSVRLCCLPPGLWILATKPYHIM